MGWFPMHESGQINTKRLMRQLEIDEGKKLKVYYDTEGLLTVGIGHLIKNTDPPEIRNLKVGDSITEDQCRELFNNDLAIAIADFRVIFSDWETIPAEVQEIIINMLFNLGRNRLLKFKKFIEAVYAKQWDRAADEMQNSRWFTQVGDRSKRLVARMRTMHVLSIGG